MVPARTFLSLPSAALLYFLASRLSPANASSGAAGLQGSHAGLVLVTYIRMRAYDLTGCIHYDRMQVS